MPTPSRLQPGARLSRRALLAVAVTGAALTACTQDSEPPVRGAERVEQEADPDVALAAAALAEQRAVLDLLRATEGRHRTLGRVLAPLVSTHEAHAAVLADAAPDEPAGGSPRPGRVRRRRGRVSPSPTRALAELVRAEEALTTTTKQHAFRARSGAFARVLGSMAAAAAQNAAVLRSTPVRGGTRP